MRESLTWKLVRNRLKWAGHVERMEGVRLTNREDALRVEGRRRKGRPRLRWEDCVKGDLAVVGGELRMRARDRGRVQTVGGKGSETGLVMKKKGGNGRPVSVPASPRTCGRCHATSVIGSSVCKMCVHCSMQALLNSNISIRMKMRSMNE